MKTEASQELCIHVMTLDTRKGLQLTVRIVRLLAVSVFIVVIRAVNRQQAQR